MYVIYAIISLIERRGKNGDYLFEELCLGYHVIANRESLFFTLNLDSAHAFIKQQVSDFTVRMRNAQEQREQDLLAHLGGASGVRHQI